MNFNRYDGPCPKDCKERKVGCHDASVCERWAAHEEKKKAQRKAAIMRGASHRMSWEARAAAEKR